MEVFQAGQVLSRSFSIWFRNLVPFSILMTLVYSPIILYGVMLFREDFSPERLIQWSLGAYALGVPLDYIGTGAVTYGVIQQLRGKPAGIIDCIKVGLARLLPILGVGILSGLFIVLGALALIIPAIIVACILWVAVPVAVVERPGVWASLERSAELTKGNRLGIFGILFILFAIDLVVDQVLEHTVYSTTDDLPLYLGLTLGTGIIFGSLRAVCMAVGYHDLRAAKEGVDVEQLAEVFS